MVAHRRSLRCSRSRALERSNLFPRRSNESSNCRRHFSDCSGIERRRARISDNRPRRVRSCVHARQPGTTHEMVYKCSCVIDAIAKDMSYEDYVDTSTAANAFTIGGQIGESVRDSETIKKMAARFREAQANAKKACFVR